MKKIILQALLLLCSAITAANPFEIDTHARLSSAAQDSASAQSNSSNGIQIQKSFKVVYTRSSGSSETSYGFSVYFGDELCFEGPSSFTTSYLHGFKIIGHDFNPLTRKDITNSLQTFKANLSVHVQDMETLN